MYVKDGVAHKSYDLHDVLGYAWIRSEDVPTRSDTEDVTQRVSERLAHAIATSHHLEDHDVRNVNLPTKVTASSYVVVPGSDAVWTPDTRRRSLCFEFVREWTILEALKRSEESSSYVVQASLTWNAITDPPLLSMRAATCNLRRLKIETGLQKVRIDEGLTKAVSFLHEHGVAHRDLKPDNVLWNGMERRVVLCDFGAAQIVRPGGTLLTDRMTTLNYAAPEVLADDAAPYDAILADLWSLGVVLIEVYADVLPACLFRKDAVSSQADVLEKDVVEGILQVVPSHVRRLVRRAPSERGLGVSGEEDVLDRIAVPTKNECHDAWSKHGHVAADREKCVAWIGDCVQTERHRLVTDQRTATEAVKRMLNVTLIRSEKFVSKSELQSLICACLSVVFNVYGDGTVHWTADDFYRMSAGACTGELLYTYQHAVLTAIGKDGSDVVSVVEKECKRMKIH